MLEVRYNEKEGNYIVKTWAFDDTFIGVDCTLLRASEKLGQGIWEYTQNILSNWSFLMHKYRLEELDYVLDRFKACFPDNPDKAHYTAHFHFLHRFLPDEHFAISCQSDVLEFILPALKQPTILLSVDIQADTTSLLIIPEKCCKLLITENGHQTIYAYGQDLNNFEPLRNGIIDSTIGAVLNKTGKMLFEERQ